MLDALVSHCMCAVIRTIHALLYYSYDCGWWNVGMSLQVLLWMGFSVTQ